MRLVRVFLGVVILSLLFARPISGVSAASAKSWFLRNCGWFERRLLMRSQEQAFRAYYASMMDADLLRVAANRISFIGTAQRVLSEELEKRHLSPAEPPVSPPRHSTFSAWRDHLTQWARRLHHHPASP